MGAKHFGTLTLLLKPSADRLTSRGFGVYYQTLAVTVVTDNLPWFHGQKRSWNKYSLYICTTECDPIPIKRHWDCRGLKPGIWEKLRPRIRFKLRWWVSPLMKVFSLVFCLFYRSEFSPFICPSIFFWISMFWSQRQHTQEENSFHWLTPVPQESMQGCLKIFWGPYAKQTSRPDPHS